MEQAVGGQVDIDRQNRIELSEQDSQNKTASEGWPGQGSKERASRPGQPGQGSQDRKPGHGSLERKIKLDSQNKIARSDPEAGEYRQKRCQNRTCRLRQADGDTQIRTGRTISA